jgi:hypothetical protein
MAGTITLLAFAILIGIAGSVLLVLGIINKKSTLTISSGVLLLITVLLCGGAIMCSLKGPCNKDFKSHHEMMREMEIIKHENCEQGQKMDSCCMHKKDSVCIEKRIERREMQNQEPNQQQKERRNQSQKQN